MLDNLIAGHRAASESFRREIEMFEASATGKYRKKSFFLGGDYTHLYSTFFLLFFGFLPSFFSFPDHHIFWVFKLIFLFRCLHILLSWYLLSQLHVLSTLNSTFSFSFLYITFILLYHSLIFTAGSTPMLADLAGIFLTAEYISEF